MKNIYKGLKLDGHDNWEEIQQEDLFKDDTTELSTWLTHMTNIYNHIMVKGDWKLMRRIK